MTDALRLITASALILWASLSQYSLWATQASTASVESRPTSEVQGYSAIQSSLPTQTRIPVRLPTFIPPYADKDNPIYAIVESVGPTGYSIQLAWAKDCNGGNWCHLGKITGSALPKQFDGYQFPVSLGPGLKAHFVDFTCGAHCDDAVIYWAEGGYYCSIAMKAEKRQTLLKMARSAIAPDHVQRP